MTKKIKIDDSVKSELIEFVPFSDSPKNWVSDYALENGNYTCRCIKCKEYFQGYKRRCVCFECANNID